MAGKTESAKTICPYFIRESTKGRIGIVCEGFEGVGEVGIYFSSTRKKRKFQENFCYCDCYKGCPVAQVVSEKYEDS